MSWRTSLTAIVIITSLLFVACGGGSGGGSETPTPEATATAPPSSRMVTSDDGALTLEIPNGAVDESTEITITAVAQGELPEPLNTVRGAGTGYRLEPDGLEFSEPVAVTLELSRAELEGEPENGISAYALVTQSDNGELEVLPEQLTEWKRGDDLVTVRGELRHFSWIGRTQGSLRLEIEPAAAIQPVGGTFTVSSTLKNLDATGLVLLRAANGEFREMLSNISVVGERVFGPRSLRGGETMSGVGTYKCPDEETSDVYFVRAFATSEVSEATLTEPPVETLLTIVVSSEVECVAGLATQTPEPTATPEPALSLSCDHRIPGEESDVIVRIRGLDPGQTVTGTVTGGGVVGDGNFTATADDNGVAEARIVIDTFSTYEVTVDGETAEITVGPVCDDEEDDFFD